MKKLTAALLILLAICIPLSAVFAQEATDQEAEPRTAQDSAVLIRYFKGEVTRVEKITQAEDGSLGYNMLRQICEIKLLTGSFEGRVYEIEVDVNYSEPQQLIMQVGTQVMLSAQLTADGGDIAGIYVYDYYRIDWFLYFSAGLIVLLMGVCLMKGLKTVVNVGFCAVSLMFYFVPLTLKGISPALLMIPICVVLAVLNTVLDEGFTLANTAALIGTIIGVGLAGIAGFAMENTAKTTGLGETELSMLFYMPDHIDLNFSGLLFACVMLIGFGGILNVCQNVAWEIQTAKEVNPYISFSKLFMSGMRAGRDFVSDNVNTIFFVLIASIMPMWLIYAAYDTPLYELINMDVISTQFFRFLAASIGMVLSMPVTALLAARFLKKSSLY